jgi:predicted enzyme related to lactoylglutathione lyase
MSGSARAGAVIFAKEVLRVSAFYRELLSMSRLHADAEHHVLQSPDLQLVIHAIPPHIASTFTIASPPEPREEAAIKLFFTVDDLDAAAATAHRLGGRINEQGWSGPGFQARDGCDPEGNVFQLREIVH